MTAKLATWSIYDTPVISNVNSGRGGRGGGGEGEAHNAGHTYTHPDPYAGTSAPRSPPSSLCPSTINTHSPALIHGTTKARKRKPRRTSLLNIALAMQHPVKHHTIV